MLHLFLALLLALVSATHVPFYCDAPFTQRMSHCASEYGTGVNIDVLGVFEVNNGSRVICAGVGAVAYLRFTPREDTDLQNANILWGDSPEPSPLIPIPCNALPGSLGSLPHPAGSVCGVGLHVYDQPGEYPAAVFANDTNEVQQQVDGFVSVKRCEAAVNNDLIQLTQYNAHGFGARVICNGNYPTSAIVRASPAPGVVVTTHGMPNMSAIWFGEINQNGPVYQYFPADGQVHVMNTTYTQPGEYGVGIFTDTNEGQTQIEGLLTVLPCSLFPN